jgi:hypothetical protein
MDQQEVTETVIEEKTSLNNLNDVIQKNWKLLLAIAVITVAIVGAIVLIGFLVISKVYGKSFGGKKKKPPKCDHPKQAPSAPSAPEESDEMTQKEKISKIDSLIDAVDEEGERLKEAKDTKDRQRLAESDVTTDDVRQIEESTSYES